jgi:hypothetical protein
MNNWHEYSKEHFLFILSQSEKKLNETVITMNTIQSRGRLQLLFSISIMTSTIGWMITSNHEITYEGYAYILIVVSLASILLCARGIYKYWISTAGTSSDKLLNNDFYMPFEDKDVAEKNLIMNECTDYAQRILKNNSINNSRLRFVTYSFILLCSIPVMVVVTYFLLGSFR